MVGRGIPAEPGGCVRCLPLYVVWIRSRKGKTADVVELLSAIAQELIRRQADVLYDLMQQDGREIARAVVGHGRLAAVGVSELPMRTALADLDEAKTCGSPSKEGAGTLLRS